jgi:disulfide oxidoreductase YuzD
MTAVEWLEQQLGSKIADANIRISAPKFYELINQAKEIEKQQIIDAFEQGDYTGRGFEDLTSEEYYNINFESK